MRVPALVLLLTLGFLVPACCCTPRTDVVILAAKQVVAEELIDSTDASAAAYGIDTHVVLVRRGRRIPMASPLLSVRPLEAATVEHVSQVSYVQDFDAEVEGADYIADPVIGVVQEGLTLEMVPAPVEAVPAETWIAYEAVQAAMKRPFRERKVHFHPQAAPGTVQLPELMTGRARGVRRVTTGVRSYLTSLATAKAGERWDIYVTVTAYGDVANYKPQPTLGGKDELKSPVLVEPATAADLGMVELEAPAVELQELAREARAKGAPDGRVRLDFVMITADLKPKELIDEATARKRIGKRSQSVERFDVPCQPMGGSAVSTLQQMAYLQDYDLAKPLEALRRANKPLPKGAKLVYHPVIGTLRAGRMAHVEQAENGLRLTLGWSTLRPIPDFRATLDGGMEVDIELPELRLTKAQVDLRPGRWLMPLSRWPGENCMTAVWIDYRP